MKLPRACELANRSFAFICFYLHLACAEHVHGRLVTSLLHHKCAKGERGAVTLLASPVGSSYSVSCVTRAPDVPAHYYGATPGAMNPDKTVQVRLLWVLET